MVTSMYQPTVCTGTVCVVHVVCVACGKDGSIVDLIACTRHVMRHTVLSTDSAGMFVGR